jgi:hypothetical protein
MSRSFWFRIRIVGWIVLIIWYILYTVNVVTPIFADSSIYLSHGITGIAGTILVLVGYVFSERKGST